jgi:hypothetical protein
MSYVRLCPSADGKGSAFPPASLWHFPSMGCCAFPRAPRYDPLAVKGKGLPLLIVAMADSQPRRSLGGGYNNSVAALRNGKAFSQVGRQSRASQT